MSNERVKHDTTIVPTTSINKNGQLKFEMFREIFLSNKQVKHDTTIVHTTSISTKVGAQMGIKAKGSTSLIISFVRDQRKGVHSKRYKI